MHGVKYIESSVRKKLINILIYTYKTEIFQFLFMKFDKNLSACYVHLLLTLFYKLFGEELIFEKNKGMTFIRFNISWSAVVKCLQH